MHAKIKKRDGRLVKFDAEKITRAIAKAAVATGEFDQDAAKKLTIQVLNLAEKLFDGRIMSVEEIQDIVEEILLSSPYRQDGQGLYHLPRSACPAAGNHQPDGSGSGRSIPQKDWTGRFMKTATWIIPCRD